MSRFILLAIVLFLLSCSRNNETKAETEDNDTLKLFKGVWAINEQENAYFFAKGDSIYSEDDRSGLKYKIQNDTIKVYYDWGVINYVILKLSKDSLYIKNEDGSLVKLYNRKDHR